MRPLRFFIFLGIFAAQCLAHARAITQQEFENLRDDVLMLSAQIQNAENQFKMSPSFYSYEREYLDYVSDLKGASFSREKLALRLKKAQVVLFGDEHSNPLSQENEVWIMQRMVDESAGPVVLILEWIQRRDQKWIDAFLAGEISKSELRKRIDFDHDWGFSWNSHVAILQAAKDLGVPVLAAENSVSESGSPIPLRSRDNHVVARMAQYKMQNPTARFLVAYGHAHLAGKGGLHLKEKLAAEGMAPDTVIFPNIEAYWPVLAETLDTEKSEVIRFSETEFYLHQGDIQRRLDGLKHYLKLQDQERVINLIKDVLKSKPSCEKLLAG